MLWLSLLPVRLENIHSARSLEMQRSFTQEPVSKVIKIICKNLRKWLGEHFIFKNGVLESSTIIEDHDAPQSRMEFRM